MTTEQRCLKGHVIPPSDGCCVQCLRDTNTVDRGSPAPVAARTKKRRGTHISVDTFDSAPDPSLRFPPLPEAVEHAFRSATGDSNEAFLEWAALFTSNQSKRKIILLLTSWRCLLADLTFDFRGRPTHVNGWEWYSYGSATGLDVQVGGGTLFAVTWWADGEQHSLQGDTPLALAVVRRWMTRNLADKSGTASIEVDPFPEAAEPLSVITQLEGGNGNSEPFFVPDDVRVWRIRWAAAGDDYPLIHLETTSGDARGSMGGKNQRSGVSYFYEPGRFYLDCNVNGKWRAQIEVVERAGSLASDRPTSDRERLDPDQAALFTRVVERLGEGPLEVTLPCGLRRSNGEIVTDAVVHPLAFHQLRALTMGTNFARFNLDFAQMTVGAIGGEPVSREDLASLAVGDITFLMLACRRATLGAFVNLFWTCQCGNEFQTG